MECISGKIIQGGDCYQKSRIKNQEDSLTTAYSRNDSAQCRTPLSGIWVREHRIPSAHVPGTRSSSGYLACFASRLPGPRNDGALLSDSAINQWVDDSMGPHSAPSELYGRGVAPFLRFHRRLFTLSHVRGFRRQPEAYKLPVGSWQQAVGSQDS